MISSLKIVQRINKWFFFSMLIIVFMIICASQSFAQEDLTLSLSSDQGAPGQTVSVNLGLSYYPYPGDPLASGFQLDINYDPDVLENPLPTKGPVLTAAGKEIESSKPSSGVFRMVVAGINKNIIQSGDAATISFDIKSDAQAGQTDLVLSDLVATDPDGDPLEVAGSDGSIDVVAAIPTLSEWGIIIFITIMIGSGVLILRKRRIV